jgi:prepilin-type processing-associated H-X9-DG protein
MPTAPLNHYTDSTITPPFTEFVEAYLSLGVTAHGVETPNVLMCPSHPANVGSAIEKCQYWLWGLSLRPSSGGEHTWYVDASQLGSPGPDGPKVFGFDRVAALGTNPNTDRALDLYQQNNNHQAPGAAPESTGGNVLFGDGHLRWVPRSRFTLVHAYRGATAPSDAYALFQNRENHPWGAKIWLHVPEQGLVMTGWEGNEYWRLFY